MEEEQQRRREGIEFLRNLEAMNNITPQQARERRRGIAALVQQNMEFQPDYALFRQQVVNNGRIDYGRLPQPAAITLLRPQPSLARRNPIPVKMFIPLVINFEQNASVQSHLEALQSAVEATSEGATPLCSILFEDLQPNQIEEAFKTKHEKPFALKNYLIGKQKGRASLKNFMSLFNGLSDAGKVSYFLRFDEDFLKDLCKRLKDPSILVEVNIGGLSPDGGPSIYHQCQYNKLSPYYTVEASKDQFFFIGRSDIAEILNSNSTMTFPLTLSGTDNPAPEEQILEVTPKHLENVSTGNITFAWTISVQYCEALLEEKIPIAVKSDVVLQNLYTLEDSSKDVAIVAANGGEIKCHKSILISQIPSFHSMLCPQFAMAEAQSGKIEMRENSEEGLIQFVRFLYGFEVPVENLNSEMVLELFQLANKYGVKKLESFMVELFLRKGIQWYAPDAIMELYFIIRNIEEMDELVAHTMIEMTKMSIWTRAASPYFKKLKAEDSLTARKFIFEIEDWREEYHQGDWNWEEQMADLFPPPPGFNM